MDDNNDNENENELMNNSFVLTEPDHVIKKENINYKTKATKVDVKKLKVMYNLKSRK